MVKGKVWKYGNNINTDIIAPPESIELSVKEAATWSMRNVEPAFASPAISLWPNITWAPGPAVKRRP